MDLVRGGLATDHDNFRPEIRLDVGGPQTLDPPLDYLGSPRSNEDPRDHGYLITYIEEFVGSRGGPLGPSVHIVHSSTNCTMLRLDGYKYWRYYGSDNQTSKGMLYKPHGWTLMVCRCQWSCLVFETDWKDEKNGEVIAEVLRVLDNRHAWPRQDAEHVAWVAPLAQESNGSSVTCELVIEVLGIHPRTNVLFFRCGISRDGLGMHLETF